VGESLKTPLPIVGTESFVKNPDIEPSFQSTLTSSQKLELLDSELACSSTQSSQENEEHNKENHASFHNSQTKFSEQSWWPRRPLVKKIINDQQVPDQVSKPKSSE
jgi:hypothetical protein